ncbi:MAG: sigma 54-interacting transcriptional regulator [Planctomycetes bacterium]|nr:sigma 54-interacting transcriptional regulator [Planctomycetota bacterium]
MSEDNFFEGLEELKEKLRTRGAVPVAPTGKSAAPEAARTYKDDSSSSILYDVIRQINYCTVNFEETLARILESTVALADAERGLLFLFDAQNELVPKVSHRTDYERLSDEERSAVDDLVKTALRSERILAGETSLKGGSRLSIRTRTMAAMAIPLRVAVKEERKGDRERRRFFLPLSRATIGALYVDSFERPRTHFTELQAVFEVLSQQATTAIVNAQIHRQATTDPLTGLYNRAYFEQCLENELRFAKDTGTPLSLVMADIDYFKILNDRYGHQVGDQVLAQTGGIVKARTRDLDCSARYGGEEFVVILPQTDAKDAQVVAEKIRAGIADASFTDQDISLTVSLGIASFPVNAASAAELIRRADQALYQAKKDGKNCWRSWDPRLGEFARRTDALAGIVVGDTAKDYRNIQMLLEAISMVNSTMEVDDLLLLVVDMLIDITQAERGILMLLDDGDRLAIRLARDAENNTLENVTFFSHSIPNKVVETGAPVWVLDTMSEDNVDAQSSSIAELQLRTVMCVPLEARDRIIGVIYVDSHSATKAFSETLFTFFYALSRQVSVAIENARLLAESVHQREEIERLNRELERKLEKTEADLAVVSEELNERRKELSLKFNYDNIVGASSKMQEIFRLLDRVTESDVPVLIQGENGTGKELIAKAIHYNGPLKERRIVSENCAAIAESLLESELFGHVKGAFSGADRDKKGLFEQASGGTLFLDEIGEMSLDMQKKLLRALQEGEIRPVGGNEVIHVAVRLISATNRDLKEMVAEGRFREDLYYRLNVVTIRIPPLRERREDIPLLVDYFLRMVAEEKGGMALRIGDDAMRILVAYDWPGNVREVQNQIRKACALGGETITAEVFGDLVPGRKAVGAGGGFQLRPMRDIEREAIQATLDAVHWNKVEAAKQLRIDRTTLYNKIAKYKLSPAGGEAGG